MSLEVDETPPAFVDNEEDAHGLCGDADAMQDMWHWKSLGLVWG